MDPSLWNLDKGNFDGSNKDAKEINSYLMKENKFHIKSTTTYFQLKGAKSIEIVNILGQKTATFNLADGQTSIDFDVSNWATGMYLVRLVCKGKVWSQGKVMVVK